MLMKSGFFLFLLTVLQVSARYKSVLPEFIEDVVELKPEAQSPSSRIASGWEAHPGQFPHHVSMRMVNPVGAVGRCGGAIVSKRWILTAAQCTAGHVNLIIRAGVVSISDNNPENIFETREWYIFPTFDDSRPTRVQPNDISLVRLQRPVEYSWLVQPIRVQSSVDAYRDYDGEQVFVSGHGRTTPWDAISDVLRWVYLRAISNDNCAKSFASGIVLNTIVCAEFYNITSQTACPRDFGGPLVHVSSEGIPTLIGLFVFTPSEDDSCPHGLPTGYTRPGPYLPWFQQITGLNFENQEEEEEVEDTTTTSSSTTTTSTSTTTPSTSTTTPSTSTITTPSTSTTTPSTSTTTTTLSTSTPTLSTSTATPSTSTTTPSTSTTTTIASPEFPPNETTTAAPNDTDEQEPDEATPDGNTTPPPVEDSEEIEEDSEDNSESNEDDDMAQLLKRLEVNVKVKVGFNKYSLSQAVGMEVNNHKH